jgi:hypothetical protein
MRLGARRVRQASLAICQEMLMKSLLSLLFGLLLALGLRQLRRSCAPDAMVRQVTEDVLTVVRQDKDIQSGNTRKAIAWSKPRCCRISISSA